MIQFLSHIRDMQALHARHNGANVQDFGAQQPAALVQVCVYCRSENLSLYIKKSNQCIMQSERAIPQRR